VTLGY
jgi:solute carrier family 25 folate transporter 32